MEEQLSIPTLENKLKELKPKKVLWIPHYNMTEWLPWYADENLSDSERENKIQYKNELQNLQKVEKIIEKYGAEKKTFWLDFLTARSPKSGCRFFNYLTRKGNWLNDELILDLIREEKDKEKRELDYDFGLIDLDNELEIFQTLKRGAKFYKAFFVVPQELSEKQRKSIEFKFRHIDTFFFGCDPLKQLVSVPGYKLY
jgi:hypothetical protein